MHFRIMDAETLLETYSAVARDLCEFESRNEHIHKCLPPGWSAYDKQPGRIIDMVAWSAGRLK